MSFNFYKKTSLWISIFISFIALTFINNYYFYEYQNVQKSKKLTSIAIIIDFIYSDCLKSSNKGRCIDKVKDFLDKNKQKASVTIKDKNVIVLQHNTRNLENDYKKNNPILWSKIKDRNELQSNLNENLEIAINPTSKVWMSVFRSVTFSTFDWVPKWYRDSNFKVKEYIDNIAIPRSRPAFFFFVFALLLYFLSWLAKRSKRNLSRQVIAEESKSNEALEDKRHLEKEVELLRVEIVSYKNQSDDSNELFEIQSKESRKIEEKLKEIEEKLKTKNNEINEFQKKQEENEKYNQPELASNRDYLRKVLTKGITSSSQPMKKSKGSHHSKDFVKKVIDAFKKDKIQDYLDSIRGIEYSEHNRGKICITKNQNDKYVINVYESSDAGYGVEIIFSGNKFYDSASLVRYIGEMKFFKGYSVIEKLK